MMTKRLASILLMAVFYSTSCVQVSAAGIIAAPVYKVDVVQPAVGIGLSKIAASDSVESTETMRSFTQINSEYASINKTLQKPEIILNGQCASCHGKVIGVLGGGSIGIRPVS